MTEQETKLLTDVKNYLDITWDDEHTNAKVFGIINRGISYLQDIAGSFSIDFAVECKARSLLFDYCRYARSNALEMFDINFKSQLISLRLATKTAVITIPTEEGV